MRNPVFRTVLMADGTRVYVHNLPWSITEELLQEHMATVRSPRRPFVCRATPSPPPLIPPPPLKTRPHRCPPCRLAPLSTCR